MEQILEQQYEMVRDSRSALLSYCERIAVEHFTLELSGFGRGGSIRNLLVHIVNTYEYWIGFHCFGRKMYYTEYAAIATVAECRNLFVAVDKLVDQLLTDFENNMMKQIIAEGRMASPFKVFLHVTTHEFHHKGQILSISRQLGYIPADTDIIR